MMIAKLKSEIEALEESVDSSIAKEDMYDILVMAYYKAKDVIEMYESTAPVTNISEEELKLVKDDLQSANITIITMTNQIQVLQEQLSHNTEVVASIMSLINSSK